MVNEVSSGQASPKLCEKAGDITPLDVTDLRRGQAKANSARACCKIAVVIYSPYRLSNAFPRS